MRCNECHHFFDDPYDDVPACPECYATDIDENIGGCMKCNEEPSMSGFDECPNCFAKFLAKYPDERAEWLRCSPPADRLTKDFQSVERAYAALNEQNEAVLA